MKKHAPPLTVSCRLMKAITRARFFILLVAVLSLPFISAASASYIKRSPVNNEAPPAARAAAQTAGLRPLLAAAPFQAGAEGLAIYQSDCMTPATDFNLGQTVCAKLTGAPVGSRPTQLLRRVAVVGPDGFIRSKVSVPGDSSTATLTFAIPTTATSLVGGETIDNRGTWQAVALDNSGSPVLRAAFVVTDTAVEVAELALGSAAITAEVAPGSNVIFRVRLVNFGPNAAGNVTVTASEPANTTFVSVTQNPAAPAFTCNTTGGTTTCTTESLPRLDKLSPATNFNIAEFTFTYDVSGAAGPGSAIEHSASVTTETAQRSTRGSLSKASALVNPAAVNVGCELTCPADVVATANTTVGGQPGAFVSYGAASVMGDCGAVINAPTSGSFFPVGTHTITSTSETGGGSCTFLVKVLDTAPPTISCPANISATAPSGSDEATVAVGTPTFTASGGGTVVGERSDSTLAEPKALTDPYPVGITAILWTVTDADGRTARCRQRVTVTANSCGTDTQAPTITAPPDVTVGTGAGNAGCSITLDDDELGQPEVSDNCSVTVAVTGAPAGNNFAPGTYTLTYTATDGAGLTASDTQVVTVVDNTAPIIAAPPDATYTCPSEVPAASPAQARGPVIGPDGLFVRDANGDLVFSGPAFDNCSVNVTVSETHNNGAGSATNPRVITRTYTATDAAGNSSSAVQTITVADGTPPTITAPADVTAYTGPGATSCDAVVNLGSPTAADNCAGVTVTRSPAGNTFPVGTTTVTWTATDAAGNTATATQQVTVIDNTPPVITPPADVVVYLPLNSTATSMAVNYPNPATAFDNCGAPINISYSPASGSVFPVGATTVTITATDSHNNSSTATFTVTVLYNFTGFFSPVNNLPTLNVVQAGRAVPVKFSLSGNKGLDIFAANSPYTVAINCDGSSPQADVAETLTAGGSSLGYTPDQYNYVWKTESSWAGTCRQLVVKLNDGSAHTANFKFK
jgi:uncharacterized repeat protein (TIGR01451 family)